MNKKGRLIKDTITVNISDPHSGGNTALMMPKMFQGLNVNHTPFKVQLEIFDHFSRCAEQILELRKKKRVILVVNGDAIDGDHHGTHEVFTRNKSEQKQVHIDLFDFFMKKIKFNKGAGDLLYYTIGTEVHTSDVEHEIGEDLEAEPDTSGLYAHRALKLDINGRLCWWLHHGTTAGDGANLGNAHRNWIRNKYFNKLIAAKRIPDFVCTAHFHHPSWIDYTAGAGNDWKRVRGLITPSWQAPTRYGHRASKDKITYVGMWAQEIKADGTMPDPVPMMHEIDLSVPLMV